MFQKIEEVVEIILGLRKFIVMMALVLIGIIFRIKGYLDGDNFVDLLKATAVAFMASNSIEHIGETIKSYVDAKGNKVQEVTELLGGPNTDK